MYYDVTEVVKKVCCLSRLKSYSYHWIAGKSDFLNQKTSFDLEK